MTCRARKVYGSIQCSSHDENTAFDCSSPDAQNVIYCFVGSTEVDSKSVDNIEAVRQLCGSRRRSLVFCRTCGLFRFGRWLTPKEKRMKLWVANLLFWQHTTGRLNKEENWLFYELSNLKWTRAFEMVATISDQGALKFSLFLKNNAVVYENNIYNVNDSADVKAIIAMFFPHLVPSPISLARLIIKEKENIDGFFESIKHEP
ncbi:hypothetical protein WUBG_13028, partial [Wuchereria bancrofti]